MKNLKGQSIIAITVVIAIVALLLRFGIEQIIKFTITQNEAYASKTLKLISTALENFAKNHNQAYPETLAGLTTTNPPYLDKDYIETSPVKGYNFFCTRLEPSGYSCEATPTKCGVSGTMSYAVTTGGVFLSEECSKKE